MVRHSRHNYCSDYLYQCGYCNLKLLSHWLGWNTKMLGQKVFLQSEKDTVIFAKWIWKEIHWPRVLNVFPIGLGYFDDLYHHDVFSVDAYSLPMRLCALFPHLLDRQNPLRKTLQKSSIPRTLACKKLATCDGVGSHFTFDDWSLYDFKPWNFQLQ